MQTVAFFSIITKLFLLSFIFFSSVLASENGVNNSNSNTSSVESIDQDWYSFIMNNLKKDEYNITFAENMDVYQSPNRSNNIRFIYHKDGFTARTRANRIPLFDVNDNTIEEENKKYEKIDEWEITFKLNSIATNTTFTGNSTNFNENELTVVRNKAFIENENIRIDYTNNEDGMRQDFIVKNRAADEGGLRLIISADTQLKMIVGADALIFNDRNGIEKMKYSSLKCWDKNGKILNAHFVKNSPPSIRNNDLKDKRKNYNESSFNSFSIVVNDKDAVYPITIDPLSTSPDWTAESNQASAYFGSCVSTAGDVNGDGFSDVMVGAYEYDNGETGEGRVFVFHGSASGLSQTANWTAESNQTDAEFGTSVSTAGDVNGDGYSDVIIGSPYFDNGETNEGRAFIYHGSSLGLSTTANWTAESNQGSAQFGVSVSTASDVNSDGFSDVIIGALFYDNGESNEGRAFVYHGSESGLSATASWTAESNQADAWFGNSVSTAGDVNGDGFSDVIVGAKVFDNAHSEEGRAFVYHGSGTGLSIGADWIVDGFQEGALYGTSVSTAGDVNGDGYSDVIVGAPSYDNAQTNAGRAFIYHGSSSGLSLFFNRLLASTQAGAEYGTSVSTAGDVNGDGYSDVIVGAPYFDNGQTNEGKAFVYHGSATGSSTTANWTAESDQSVALLGASVSTAGDVNGDGYSDVITGARFYTNGETNEGRAFIYHGSASGLSLISGWTDDNNGSGSRYGSCVSSAGDVNGDGYSDVIVGDYTSKAVIVEYGLKPLLFPPQEIINSSIVGFGWSVSTAGDVNGDGYSDVIVGASEFNQEGRTYVYHGSASGISGTASWTAEGSQVSAQFGASVSTAGDVNGDGFSDVIVGSPKFDNGETDEGRVFVYYGSDTGLSTTPNWIVDGDIEDVLFGTSVSTAGDVNGDGFSDIIVGRGQYIFDAPDNGMAFVYYGSKFGLSTIANWTAESNDVTARFGYSVSSAGDVNGDGFSDVIVGAALFSNVQNYEGSAYVYYGSAVGLSSTASWTAEGNQVGALFGLSVSTAGDVNGDGFSDVIVGAPGFDNGETDEGRVYVYHGSELGLSIAEQWLAEGNLNSAYFGYSVSTIGDYNGDGYSDVIVGEDGEQLGQVGFGDDFNSVNIYYGNSGTGLASKIQQYRPSSSNIIAAGGFSGTAGTADLGLFAKSPFGRADGRMVYEHKANGVPFSIADGKVTNSVDNSGVGAAFDDLGLIGTELEESINGLSAANLYKWRVRTEYSMVNNPLQKYGPWRYYSSYAANLPNGFKPSISLPLKILASLTVYLEGPYNSSNTDMDINLIGNIPLISPYSEDPQTVASIPPKVVDWVLVSLRSKINATNILASRSAFLLEDGSIVELTGAGPVQFSLPSDNYFISIEHRNHLEVMSSNSIALTTN